MLPEAVNFALGRGSIRGRATGLPASPRSEVVLLQVGITLLVFGLEDLDRVAPPASLGAVPGAFHVARGRG